MSQHSLKQPFICMDRS